MTCDHDFKGTWRCWHRTEHREECASGQWTYKCKRCKEPGYAVLDGVKPTTTIYGEYSAVRQQEMRDQVEGTP